MTKKQEDKKINTEDFEKLQKELESLKEASLQMEAQLKRAVADYQNLEKRVSDGRSELTSYVGAEIIRKMLPVLDHLEQALGGVTEDQKQNGWVKGVEMAVKEFNQALQAEGLTQIEAQGQFDPSLHEAVDTRAGDDNIILEIVRKGYSLNGKVLRPAQVVVGHQSNENPEPVEGSI